MANKFFTKYLEHLKELYVGRTIVDVGITEDTHEHYLLLDNGTKIIL